MVDGPGPRGGMRGVARAYLVLGLAAACFALFAVSLDPAMYGQLQLQMAKDSDKQQLEQGQADCAPTAAEVMEMRADAMVVLMLGAAQALLGMASFAATSPFFTVCAQIVSLPMAWKLLDVLAGVVDVAIGRCHGSYHHAVVAGYTIIAVSFSLLFFFGLVITCVTLCGQSIGDASSPCGQAPDHLAIDVREIKDSSVRTVHISTAVGGDVTSSKPAPAPG